MYEERKNTFSLRDFILQLLIVILFIFVMIWLFPTKSYLDNNYVTNENIKETIEEELESLYGRLFADNMESMKNAAKDYFTTSKLPSKVGDSVKLTLGQMIDKKLILALKDSNNESCNIDESYVEVTKMDNDYQMKVQLTCSDYSDYILVTMGCYDLCGDSCTNTNNTTTTKPTTTKPSTNKPTTTVKTYLYEYKLVTKNTYSDWSKWSSWSKDKVTATNLMQVETKKETEITGYKQVYGIIKYNTKKYTDYEKVTTYKTVTEEVQVGTTKEYQGKQTVNAVVDTKAAIKVSSGNTYSEWKTVDTITTTNKVMYNTDTVKYVLKSTNKVLNCENSCVYDTVRVYEKQTRTATSGTSTYSCATYGSAYKLDGTNCVKKEVKTVDIYIDVPVYETVEKKVPVTTTKAVTKTKKVPVYGYKNGDPITEEVTYYRYRTRKQLTEASTSYKYSKSNNDKSLLNAGYVLTGNKKEA